MEKQSGTRVHVVEPGSDGTVCFNCTVNLCGFFASRHGVLKCGSVYAGFKHEGQMT